MPLCSSPQVLYALVLNAMLNALLLLPHINPLICRMPPFKKTSSLQVRCRGTSTVLLCGYMLVLVSNVLLRGMASEVLTRKLLQALEQIPDLTLLDFADISHEVRNFAS